MHFARRSPSAVVVDDGRGQAEAEAEADGQTGDTYTVIGGSTCARWGRTRWREGGPEEGLPY